MLNLWDIRDSTLEQVENGYRYGTISQDLYEAFVCLWKGATFRYASNPTYCPQCDMIH